MRLFPLPNLVMFPHVMQPLHIYEPRYREMLATRAGRRPIDCHGVWRRVGNRITKGGPRFTDCLPGSSHHTSAWKMVATTCCCRGCGGWRGRRELPRAALSKSEADVHRRSLCGRCASRRSLAASGWSACFRAIFTPRSASAENRSCNCTRPTRPGRAHRHHGFTLELPLESKQQLLGESTSMPRRPG